MKDEAEQSNPSTGSVAGEPVAWGIQFWGGDIHHEVFDTKEQAEKELHRSRTGAPPDVCTARVVSLCLKPTLTDEEREAIGVALQSLQENYRGCNQQEIDTLRSLLRRVE